MSDFIVNIVIPLTLLICSGVFFILTAKSKNDTSQALDDFGDSLDKCTEQLIITADSVSETIRELKLIQSMLDKKINSLDNKPKKKVARKVHKCTTKKSELT